MDGGQLLGGRYRVGQVLGRGGMATVHAGHDETLGRDVAVKIFRPDVGDPGAHDRQVAEIRVLARVSHPNLVTLYDAHLPTVNDFSPAYIVMELVTGPTLAQLIEGGTLTPRRTAAIGADLARGLSAAHAAGVVHSDVKPGNVLLTPGGTPKLADFGIAALVGAAQLTGTGQTLGTPAYLSPEQVTAAPVTGASDVYSLGLVLLECLTGDRSYPGTGVQVALARLGTQPSIPASLPAGWAPLLARMTDREPARRPSPAEVTQVLDGLAAGDAAGATTVVPQVSPPTERLYIPPPLPPVAAAPAPVPVAAVRQREPASAALVAAIVVGVALLVAAVALGVFLLTRTTGDDTPDVQQTPLVTATTSTSATPSSAAPSTTPPRTSAAATSAAPTTAAATSAAPTTRSAAPTTAAATTAAAATTPPVVSIETSPAASATP